MIWALLQQVDQPGYPWVSLGVGGAVSALVITLWRQERKESAERYAALAKEALERYAALGLEFRTIVQDNTKALVVLSDRLANQEGACAVAVMLMELIKSGKGKTINIEP
jgi:hypothetical protein